MSSIPVDATRKRRLCVIATLVVCLPGIAKALILGGKGNDPIRDPGWPRGAAAVFNVTGRIAYWEGPPFGGGEWHAECRGTAEDFNRVLVDFASIEADKKRLVIHDGAGRSFWLNPNREPGKVDAARVDWTFTVWQPENWERLQKLPADFRAPSPDDQPVPQLDLYTADIHRGDLEIPRGIEVDDRRLEARGYSLDDGVVVEGTVTELSSGRPLQGKVELQSIESQPAGGYRYETVQTVATNAAGQWVLKSPPPGSHRLIVSAPLHVPRVAEHFNFDSEPRWMELPVALARGGRITGRTVDADGNPLEGVEVKLGNIDAGTGDRYRLPQDPSTVTNSRGRFELIDIPEGNASIHVRATGYVRPGPSLKVTVPSEDHTLTLVKAASIAITVDFGGKPRLQEYIVELTPEGGNQVGSWGGSGTIDGDGKREWNNIPPGRYVATGHPNPGRESDRTEPVTVELKGGERTEVTVVAR